MVFSSFHFLFYFLPALLLLYFLLPKQLRAGRNLLLLAFSLFFYAYGGVRFLPLMLASIGINYVFGLLCAPGARGRKAALWVGTALNLALLGWFKYAGFAAQNLRLLGVQLAIPDVVLPIGISFFTFQGMSYVFDVYRGDAQPEKNPLWVALYVSLFPQLVAGPIVRYSTVAEEIRCRREGADDMAEGLQRFLFGLAKKVLLANQMGLIADAAFSQTAPRLSMGLAWLGVIGYTLQIYFDFSGYSDMAIGLGRVFGFHFLENFNYPYVSRSVTEFWRRWHISLSTWFRDYLYIPLGGNRVSRGKQIRNLLIVWALTGFWHGAAWNFLFWGLYYALLLMGERYCWGRGWERMPAALRHMGAMLLVMLGWLLFRASGTEQILLFLRAMVGAGEGGLWTNQVSYLLRQFWPELLAAPIACLPVAPWLRKKLSARDEGLGAGLLRYGAPGLALLFGGLSAMKLVEAGFNPFIYFQF